MVFCEVNDDEVVHTAMPFFKRQFHIERGSFVLSLQTQRPVWSLISDSDGGLGQ